jgi:hypothetical protein
MGRGIVGWLSTPGLERPGYDDFVPPEQKMFILAKTPLVFLFSCILLSWPLLFSLLASMLQSLLSSL